MKTDPILWDFKFDSSTQAGMQFLIPRIVFRALPYWLFVIKVPYRGGHGQECPKAMKGT
jgi:hypothetical protein